MSTRKKPVNVKYKKNCHILNVISEFLHIKKGVPRGGILGTILLVISFNDKPNRPTIPNNKSMQMIPQY